MTPQEAQEQIQTVANALAEVELAVTAILAALPASPNEDAELETGLYTLATEIRSTLQSSTADHLRPALAALVAVCGETDEGLAEAWRKRTDRKGRATAAGVALAHRHYGKEVARAVAA